MHKELEEKLISPRLSAELIEEVYQLDDTQKAALDVLYEDISQRFQAGKIVLGKIISKEHNGILVNIEYKSDGFIPNYEFSDYELEKLPVGSDLDVILDRLEDENGIVVLSYQKAKALKAWDNISKLAETDEPVRGVVTHKVKGGLSVD
ncbi:MAG: S1 RNA-binding domain-containing protein, partial [bacterium]